MKCVLLFGIVFWKQVNCSSRLRSSRPITISCRNNRIFGPYRIESSALWIGGESANHTNSSFGTLDKYALCRLQRWNAPPIHFYRSATFQTAPCPPLLPPAYTHSLFPLPLPFRPIMHT